MEQPGGGARFAYSSIEISVFTVFCRVQGDQLHDVESVRGVSRATSLDPHTTGVTALAGALIQHIFVSASSRLTALVLRHVATPLHPVMVCVLID